MSTGKWRVAGIPHTGWVCVDVEDLGSPSMFCEMCEVQEIRFVHTMEHRDYPEPLQCGCVCAGHMEQDMAAARSRDGVLQARAMRKDKWLERKWRFSQAGNEFLNVMGYNVVVFQRGGVWAFRVLNRYTDDSLISRKPYLSMDEAKLRAFDAVEWMRSKGR
jgi:hypothetical protein